MFSETGFLRTSAVITQMTALINMSLSHGILYSHHRENLKFYVSLSCLLLEGVSYESTIESTIPRGMILKAFT
jgi:hypothetical protein